MLELSAGIVIAIDTLLMFLVLFFLLNHSINRFIFEKIKIIYKTIHNFQVSQDLDHKSRINETLDNVNEQVVEWGKQQKKEIDDLSVLVSYEDIINKNDSLSAGQYFDIKINYVDISEEEFEIKLAKYKSALTDIISENSELQNELLDQLNLLQFNKMED